MTQSRRELLSSGLLRREQWQFLIYVSEQTSGPISRIKTLTLEMGPIGCPEMSERIITALWVITQNTAVLFYFAAEATRHSGDRNLFPLCANCLRFYYDSAETTCDGHFILPEL